MAASLDPSASYLPSLDDPESSSGFVVQTLSEAKGRGIIATQAFRKEQTIFKESPLVSAQFCWNSAYGYRACHFCMEPLESAQENVCRLANDNSIVLGKQECCSTRKNFHCLCPQCGVEYCSKTCMEQAWDTWHKTLCMQTDRPDPNHPHLQLIEYWKSIHHPPETTSIVLFTRILASVVQGKADIGAYLNFVHTDHEHELAHKLLGAQFSEQRENLRQRLLALFPNVQTQALLTPEGFAKLLALVGRNGQGMATSPFSQWVQNVEKQKIGQSERDSNDQIIEKAYEAMDQQSGLDFLDNEGSGLYRMQSLLNHSCRPNAEVTFPCNNDSCVVRATRNIESGEEIVISYLNECDLEDRSRHSRQKLLKENYLFECKCERCEEELGTQEDVTSEEEMEDDEEEEEEEQRQQREG